MAARHPQRGATLIEALVAFLALSLGMLALTRLESALRSQADLARQRSEAVRLAQQDIEQLRAFSSLETSAGASAFDDIADNSLSVGSEQGYASNAEYAVERQVHADSAGYKTATVQVSWADRSGQTQQVRLSALISRSDPAQAAALAIPSPPLRPLAPFGRHAAIPLNARDLGDGRSALKQPNEPRVIVFDNLTGEPVGLCSVAVHGLATRQLSVATLQECTDFDGLSVRGTVRFSLGVPPAVQAPDDLPLPLDMAVALAGEGGPAPACVTETLQVVTYTLDGERHRTAVPLGASPPVDGASDWRDTGERHAAYTCAVAVDGGTGTWSGRTSVVPRGWSLGTTADTYRVCRVVADYDGSGTIDRNPEHPADYVDVEEPLLHQNFLVIRGDQPCPDGSAGLHALAHQP